MIIRLNPQRMTLVTPIKNDVVEKAEDKVENVED